jgi:hypothetical protein
MEHNQGCSPFYFSSQFSVVSLPQQPISATVLTCLVFFYGSQILPMSSLIRTWASEFFQQFCGKRQDNCVQLQE